MLAAAGVEVKRKRYKGHCHNSMCAPIDDYCKMSCVKAAQLHATQACILLQCAHDC